MIMFLIKITKLLRVIEPSGCGTASANRTVMAAPGPANDLPVIYTMILVSVITELTLILKHARVLKRTMHVHSHTLGITYCT